MQFCVIPKTLFGGGGSYLSEVIQSVYSTAAANWTVSYEQIEQTCFFSLGERRSQFKLIEVRLEIILVSHQKQG